MAILILSIILSICGLTYPIWKNLLKKEDITARQVAVIMDIPLRTIERELSVLKKKGVIQHIGSPRAGRWIVLGNY